MHIFVLPQNVSFRGGVIRHTVIMVSTIWPWTVMVSAFSERLNTSLDYSGKCFIRLLSNCNLNYFNTAKIGLLATVKPL